MEFKEKYEMIKSVRRYIENHLYDTMDLQALARRYGCSYTVFREAFWEIGKFTPHQYIRLRCMQKAAQYLREGYTVTETAHLTGFQTEAGFYKAFRSVFKVSPREFRASRGMAFMEPPTLMEKEDFFIVGYVIDPTPDFTPSDWGAYWMIQSCPEVSEEEYGKIGGGPDMTGIWVNEAERRYYLLGPQVHAVRHVPEHMAAYAVPGGLFLKFPVPKTENILILYENVLVTWYYARQQWLPLSPYEEDTTRIPFEYYLWEDNAVLIPIKEKQE